MHENLHDELISAYLDGELSGKQQAQVEELLMDSPGHRRLFNELRVLRDSLQALPGHELDQDFANRVLRRAEEAIGNPAREEESGHDVIASDVPHQQINNLPTASMPHAAPDRGVWRTAVAAIVAVAAVLLLVIVLGPPATDRNDESARNLPSEAGASKGDRESEFDTDGGPTTEISGHLDAVGKKIQPEQGKGVGEQFTEKNAAKSRLARPIADALVNQKRKDPVSSVAEPIAISGPPKGDQVAPHLNALGGRRRAGDDKEETRSVPEIGGLSKTLSIAEKLIAAAKYKNREKIRNNAVVVLGHSSPKAAQAAFHDSLKQRSIPTLKQESKRPRGFSRSVVGGEGLEAKKREEEAEFRAASAVQEPTSNRATIKYEYYVVRGSPELIETLREDLIQRDLDMKQLPTQLAVGTLVSAVNEGDRQGLSAGDPASQPGLKRHLNERGGLGSAAGGGSQPSPAGIPSGAGNVESAVVDGDSGGGAPKRDIAKAADSPQQANRRPAQSGNADHQSVNSASAKNGKVVAEEQTPHRAYVYQLENPQVAQQIRAIVLKQTNLAAERTLDLAGAADAAFAKDESEKKVASGEDDSFGIRRGRDKKKYDKIGDYRLLDRANFDDRSGDADGEQGLVDVVFAVPVAPPEISKPVDAGEKPAGK